MIPLPTVAATAVPDSAPNTFIVAAMSTAWPGDNTRVATEVAIALAVSWNPLIKSNPRPRTTIRTTTRNSVLGILAEDPFERMPDVLALVGRVFNQMVNLAPTDCFDQLRNLAHALIEGGKHLIENLVRFVFQPMQLQNAPLEIGGAFIGSFQVRHVVRQELRLLNQFPYEKAPRPGSLPHPVKPKALAHSFEPIDKIVQCAGQRANVLSVEGCHEGAVERLVDAVRDVIAFMFELPETPHLAVGIRSKLDDFGQDVGHLQAVLGGIIEM